MKLHLFIAAFAAKVDWRDRVGCQNKEVVCKRERPDIRKARANPTLRNTVSRHSLG